MKRILLPLLMLASVASGETNDDAFQSFTGAIMQAYWKASDVHMELMHLSSEYDRLLERAGRVVTNTVTVTAACQRAHCDTFTLQKGWYWVSNGVIQQVTNGLSFYNHAATNRYGVVLRNRMVYP